MAVTCSGMQFKTGQKVSHLNGLEHAYTYFGRMRDTFLLAHILHVSLTLNANAESIDECQCSGAVGAMVLTPPTCLKLTLTTQRKTAANAMSTEGLAVWLEGLSPERCALVLDDQAIKAVC